MAYNVVRSISIAALLGGHAAAVEPSAVPSAVMDAAKPAGDGAAAPGTANGTTRETCRLPRDATFGSIEKKYLAEPKVFRCLLKTAERGDDKEAVAWAQVLLWEGKIDIGTSGDGGALFPRSEARLKKYIDVGVALGSHYSTLAKAAYLQDIDPDTSLDLYKRVAINDDCRGQVMLAWMYQKGIGTEVNDALAYFWGRLGRRREYNDESAWGEGGVTYVRPVLYFEQRVSAIIPPS